MSMAASDLELLDRYRERGDAAAFSEIVRRYAPMVYGAGRRILGETAAAEDVTQETFFRLLRRPSAISQSLGGWLHQAATRLAVDMKRSERARRRRQADYGPARGESSWLEVSRELDLALAALPDASRELIVRHFLRGEPQARLAADLSTSAATLSRRMKVSIEELRLEMRKRGVDLAPALLVKLFVGKMAPLPLSKALSLELAKLMLFCTARSGGKALLLRRMIQSLHRLWRCGALARLAAFSACTTLICLACYAGTTCLLASHAAAGSKAAPTSVDSIQK